MDPAGSFLCSFGILSMSVLLNSPSLKMGTCVSASLCYRCHENGSRFSFVGVSCLLTVTLQACTLSRALRALTFHAHGVTKRLTTCPQLRLNICTCTLQALRLELPAALLLLCSRALVRLRGARLHAAAALRGSRAQRSARLAAAPRELLVAGNTGAHDVPF